MNSKLKLRLKELKKDSKKMMELIRQEALASQFLIGSHNAIKLEKSLALIDRLDLADKTLLTPSIHRVHSKRLEARYIKKWQKLKKSKLESWSKLPLAHRKNTSKPTEDEIASSQLRFFTLVDSVTAMDHQSALKVSILMKNELLTSLAKTKGLWCLGAIEGEVISLKAMRRIRDEDVNGNSERRKLDVCEVLASELGGTLFENDSSLFLIHFHGVLVAKNEGQFSEFNNNLQKIKRWNVAPRQIEIKKLSTQFNNKPKGIEMNLKHIATYLTKGGNDWVSNKAYLRYKIGFENDDFENEQIWILKNWRRSELLKKEHSEEGITDSLSLTSGEIIELTLFLDNLMSLNRTRTGYLISTGS